MVITFLLILLSIVIFVLSQNKAKQAVDDAQAKSNVGKVKSQSQSQARTQSQEQSEAQSKSQAKAQSKAKSRSKAESKSQAKSKSQAQSKSQSQSKSQMKVQQEKVQPNSTAGTFKPNEGKPLTQAEKIESRNKLKVRSRAVQDEKRIVIAPEEKPIEQKKIKVLTAKSLLTLEFTESNIRIDDASVQAIQGFLSSNSDIKGDGKVEIRSYANSSVGSISEARRLAFYRAMATRNQLLKSGVDPKRISIRVRESRGKDEKDLVKVFLKP